MSSIDAEALYRAVLEQIRAAYGAGFGGPDGAVLAGIYSGGAWLAERLAHDLNVASFGVVNVALHRDDYAFGPRYQIHRPPIPGTILPGIIQFASWPCSSTCSAPKTVIST